MDDGGAAGGLFAMLFLLIELGIVVICFASFWVIFTKAGEPGFLGIIPIVNAFFLLKIAGKPVWWIILFFIPLVNFIAGILVTVALAEKFGKGIGFAVGMIFLPFIFYPLLAFGDAEYQG